MTQTWEKAPAGTRLSREKVDVWRASHEIEEARFDEYLGLLSTAEVERANRFRVKRKYREYIISRGLLRTVLGLTLDLDPAVFKFEYSEHDKPFLDMASQGLPVCFNVSHSHKQTVIALSLGRAIGIDIEHVRRDVEFKKLATRFFSSQEAEDLNTYTESGLPRAFFACWTRKEAFVKALGDGIAFGLDEFSVSVDPDEDIVSLTTHWDRDEAVNWSLLNINTGEDYLSALAVEGSGFSVRYWAG